MTYINQHQLADVNKWETVMDVAQIDKNYNPPWLVQEDSPISTHPESALMVQALQAEGVPHQVLSRVDQLDGTVAKLPEKFIPYGTLQFVNRARIYADKMRPYPGTYFTNFWNMRCSTYESRMVATFLNKGVYIPWARVDDGSLQKYFIRDWGEKVFIRPDSGMKGFDGQVVELRDLPKFKRDVDSFSPQSPDSMVKVCPESPDILSEYRLVVAAKNRDVEDGRLKPTEFKIVTGSQYKQDGNTFLSASIPNAVIDAAELFIKNEWQPAEVYTLDIAMLPRGTFPVEINSVTAAALYCCDRREVVRALNDYVRLDRGIEKATETLP